MIMQANKLTLELERHTGRRPGRTHDGVVIARRSNLRWCSYHFELACRNGEIVRVLFAIDAWDREVMGWLATSAGISGEMVRDLMVACVERRFGISKARPCWAQPPERCPSCTPSARPNDPR
jgi:putative transposase